MNRSMGHPPIRPYITGTHSPLSKLLPIDLQCMCTELLVMYVRTNARIGEYRDEPSMIVLHSFLSFVSYMQVSRSVHQ